MQRNYEEQAQRRMREVEVIKTMYYDYLREGLSCMEAYEMVGYWFFRSTTEIRHIIKGRR
jgi:hypothetical protein